MRYGLSHGPQGSDIIPSAFKEVKAVDMRRSKSYRADMTHYRRLAARSFSYQKQGETQKHCRRASCVSPFIRNGNDFIYHGTTLFNFYNIYTSLIVPYSTVTDLARFLG